MAGQFLRFGKWGVALTIPGLILAWVIGTIFGPKSCAKNESIDDKFVGAWFLTTDTNFTRIDIKEMGYFSLEVIPTKSKPLPKTKKPTIWKPPIPQKGMFKENKDYFTLLTYGNDTLFHHKIIKEEKKKLILKSVKDNIIITLTKE